MIGEGSGGRSGGRLVYEELRERILDLRLEPGQRLYEPELSADLGVSRTPLREALRLLMAEDLLEQLPTGGMVVRTVSARDAEELYGVRARLEGLLAERAAERVDARGVAALRDLLDRNAALAGLPTGAMDAGQQIHQEIARIADHGWATRMLAHIDGQLARYRRFSNTTQERRDAALEEHRGIVEAVATGDSALAARLAQEHVLAARDSAPIAIEA